MTQTVKLEVEISLSDFFNNEDDRQHAFRGAMEGAIIRQLNNSEFVQSNIAYYLFKQFTTDIFAGEFQKIQDAVREKISKVTFDKYDIMHNDVFKKAMDGAIDGMKSEIEQAALTKAREIIQDEGRDYPSFYSRIADAMVDNVFKHFVDAMVEKAERTS